MSSVAAPTSEDRLLRAAQAGDESAFASLIEPYTRELHAHCYRMLGSVYDADDAMQDATLRAWKAIKRFEGRSSLRSWLYTIATNTCLTQIQRRPKRVLPVDYGPATDPFEGPGQPITETVWIEPYPDTEIEDGLAGPEARYEQRESVELAFIAALQHLPASQRAVLILREVLGFSAKEVAEALETLRTLDDDEITEIVKTYVDAWERGDVEAVVALLTEDAAIAMPPLASWFGPGREVFREFLERWPLSGAWRWRVVQTRANGEPALGFYAWDEEAEAYLPFALNVLTLRGDRVSDVTAFVARSTEAVDDEAYARWPELASDPRRLRGTFERFELPDRLD